MASFYCQIQINLSLNEDHCIFWKATTYCFSKNTEEQHNDSQLHKIKQTSANEYTSYQYNFEQMFLTKIQ